MYNKIFTKILDSSIWFESMPTRIVWLTLIAAMDEDGFVQFASVKNLAHRARVTTEEAQEAIAGLEKPDGDSSDPDHEGRRVERVPGGWIVLNARKYRELVTRVVIKEQTRKRVAKFRAAKASCNAHVTQCNENVTPSVAVSEARAEARAVPPGDVPSRKPSASGKLADDEFLAAIKSNPAYEGIDVERELGKMSAWFLTPKARGRKITRGFIVNWLNKIDLPMNGHAPENLHTKKSAKYGW